MQLKKAKAMEANKIGEDKNCDATATSKLDVSAQVVYYQKDLGYSFGPLFDLLLDPHVN